MMQLTDSQARWDAWMFLAQSRLMRNFTVPQWEVVKALNIFMPNSEECQRPPGQSKKREEDDATAHRASKVPTSRTSSTRSD